MKRFLTSAGLAACLACSTWAYADTVVIDFEGLADQEWLTTQFQASDVQFSNALVAVSGAVGGSLNEFDYPPASGDAVAFNAADTMMIDFLRPVVRVAGRFTYAGGPLTLVGRDGAVDALSVSSAASGNLGAPNELLQLTYASGLTSLVITGIAGVQFTLDDLEIEFAQTAAVPEPTLTLLTGVALVTATRWRRTS